MYVLLVRRRSSVHVYRFRDPFFIPGYAIQTFSKAIFIISILLKALNNTIKNATTIYTIQ